MVLVEAVAPGSMAEAWGAWEPDLLARGYRFAFFDRLNRFYVAEEAKDLAARFPAEPAAWDQRQAPVGLRPRARSAPTIPTTSWRRCCSRASSRSCRRSILRCCAASSSAG